jgi:hypothetical protein
VLAASILFNGCDQLEPQTFSYNAFPDVIRTRSGKLVMVFYNGVGHESFKKRRKSDDSKGGRILFSESTDNGTTWSKPVTIIDTPFDDRDPSIFQAMDGRLLVNFFSLTGNNTRRYLQTRISESSDGGRTWQEPQLIFENKATTSPIRQLSDGRLAMTLYEPPGGCTIVFSKDGGRSWGGAVVVGGYGTSDVSEPDLVEVGNKLIIYMRSDNSNMKIAESTNGGKTWSPMNDCGFTGAAPYLYNHNKEVVFLAHRIPTTSVRVWYPQQNRWDPNTIIDYDMEANGAYPSIAQVDTNKFVVVYYYESIKDVVSQIRVRSMELGEDGLVVSPSYAEVGFKD